MLGTPKALGDAIEGEAVSQVKPACPEDFGTGWNWWEG